MVNSRAKGIRQSLHSQSTYGSRGMSLPVGGASSTPASKERMLSAYQGITSSASGMRP